MEEGKHLLEIYFDRLSKIGDPAAIVFTTHAFCEHAINELLLEKKKIRLEINISIADHLLL